MPHASVRRTKSADRLERQPGSRAINNIRNTNGAGASDHFHPPQQPISRVKLRYLAPSMLASKVDSPDSPHIRVPSNLRKATQVMLESPEPFGQKAVLYRSSRVPGTRRWISQFRPNLLSVERHLRRSTVSRKRSVTSLSMFTQPQVRDSRTNTVALNSKSSAIWTRRVQTFPRCFGLIDLERCSTSRN